LLSLATVAIDHISTYENWFKLTDYLFQNQEQFTDDKVHQVSRSELESQLALIVKQVCIGVDNDYFLKTLRTDENVVKSLKAHTRFGRQNGKVLYI
jgi:hypothetical protein